MNRDLWAVLVGKCETEALQKVNSASQGEGLWAYIRVHQWYNKTTELGRTNRLIGIMRPDACKHEYEIAGAVEKWEEKYRRVMDEDGAEESPERYKMTALKCLLTGEIKKHVELREDDLATYSDLRAIIMKYVSNKRIEKERGSQPMDLDAATDEYKGKGPGSDNGNWNINGHDHERNQSDESWYAEILQKSSEKEEKGGGKGLGKASGKNNA